MNKVFTRANDAYGSRMVQLADANGCQDMSAIVGFNESIMEMKFKLQ